MDGWKAKSAEKKKPSGGSWKRFTREARMEAGKGLSTRPVCMALLALLGLVHRNWLPEILTEKKVACFHCCRELPDQMPYPPRKERVY